MNRIFSIAVLLLLVVACAGKDPASSSDPGSAGSSAKAAAAPIGAAGGCDMPDVVKVSCDVPATAKSLHTCVESPLTECETGQTQVDSCDMKGIYGVCLIRSSLLDLKTYYYEGGDSTALLYAPVGCVGSDPKHVTNTWCPAQ